MTENERVGLRVQAAIDLVWQRLDDPWRSDLSRRAARCEIAYLRTLVSHEDDDVLNQRREWLLMLRESLGDRQSDRYARDALFTMVPANHREGYLDDYRFIFNERESHWPSPVQ